MKRLARIVAAVGLWGLSTVCCFADMPSRDFTTQTKTASTSTAATDTALWTPASGKRIILQGVIACASGPITTVEIEEDDNTDVIPPFAIESYGCKTFTAGGSAIWMGDPDEYLTYTLATSGPRLSIMAWGYEIQ